jgi:hypothetical protein
MQVKHTTEVVSPDEYDEAVQRDPRLGALCLTGDLRTGQQLLADAAEDKLRTVGWMAACPRGRAELDAIAAATELLAKNLEGVGIADCQSHGISS